MNLLIPKFAWSQHQGWAYKKQVKSDQRASSFSQLQSLPCDAWVSFMNVTAFLLSVEVVRAPCLSGADQ